MGKVYEALKRSQAEEANRNLSAASLPGGFTQAATAAAHEPAVSFDFMDYSLSALPADEVAKRNQEAATIALDRHARVAPASQVTLELSRVDPHLTTLFDADLDSGRVASEQYNKLAISMISQKDERTLKKILIASTHRAEGRTCVALNLAGALARARQRVLVIDADLHRPSVVRLLGIETEVGLPDLLKRDLPPGQMTIEVLPFGFHVLPTREPVENSAELLTSPRFRQTLSMLEAEYDFVLFDSSPLLRGNDANLLVRLTNATIFVIRSGKTSSIQLGKAIGPLTQDHIFGVVLNRADSWATQ